MRKRVLLWTLALAGLALTSLPAVAQPIRYQITDNAGNAFTTAPTLSANQTVTWRVYLLDTGGTTAPTLNAPTSGSGGTNVVGISGSAVTLASSNTGLLTVGSNPPPPVTNTGNNSTTPTATGTSWQTWSNNGSQVNSIHLTVGTFTGSVAADATGRILLGAYTFTVPANPTAGSVTLTASDANPAQSGDTAYAGSGASLDASIGNGTQAVTIAAVPEPGSMLLCGLGAVGLAAYRRRFRKTVAVEVA